MAQIVLNLYIIQMHMKSMYAFNYMSSQLHIQLLYIHVLFLS